MRTESRFEDGLLIVTREFAAPREAVFEAWVETNKVKQWWGCAECNSVRSEVDPKVGGRYNHHMTIEGVGEVPGFATLTEYSPPERLAYESQAPGDKPAKMTVTVTFTETDEGTLVRLEHAGIPDIRVEGDMELRSIVRDGWTAAFGKLGTFLETPV